MEKNTGGKKKLPDPPKPNNKKPKNNNRVNSSDQQERIYNKATIKEAKDKRIECKKQFEQSCKERRECQAELTINT